MRLVQSQEPAAETAPGLKLEILGVGHSDAFLLIFEASFPHCDNPFLRSPKEATK